MGWNGIGIGWPNASAQSNPVINIQTLINNFKTRVFATYNDPGFNNEQNLYDILADFQTEGLLTKANLITTPTGIGSSVIGSVIPNDEGADFAFDRNSYGTAINQNGLIYECDINIPRITYKDGYPYLLKEDQSTNYIVNSINFNAPSWETPFPAALTVDYSIQPPSTFYNTYKFTIIDESNYFYTVDMSPSIPSYRTFSIYVKAGNAVDWICIDDATGNGNFAWYNIRYGYIGTVNTGDAYIESVGNDWYRCIRVSNSSYTEYNLVSLVSQNGTSICDINGATCYVYGPQAELNDYATSFILTTGTIQTRLTDNAYVSIPDGTVKITTYLYDDSTTQFQPFLSLYQLDYGLTKSILMQNTL
jgi:hypothetical protein